MRLSMAGMEVPIIGSDSLKWFDVSVPTALTDIDDDAALRFAPPAEDRASCSAPIQDPPRHLVWRIHKTSPNSLELFELSASQEFPRIGLRLVFSQSLSPFAFICTAHQALQISSAPSSYFLYALTVSGRVYLLKLSSNLASYSSCSVFPRDELVELDMRAYTSHGSITSLAAAPGCLVLGRDDGSVGCFQLGFLDPTAPGFVHELRDDSGISRLWGFMSRGRIVGAVRDLVISDVYGKKLLFTLHSDGIVRAWDLSCYSRIFSHALSAPTPEGAKSVRLWVGEPNRDSNDIPLAILYRSSLEIGGEMIYVYSLHCSLGERLFLSVESSVRDIPLVEGGCIDVKLTSDKIWILKDNGLVYHCLFHTNTSEKEECFYTLQEEFVADQLFQRSEHSSDNLISVTHSIFSSGKGHAMPFVSSIFLRGLLHPGVYHNTVLRATFLDYNKHWTDSEFQSLTVDGLKKEILSLVEHESFVESPASIFHGWKNFCTRYFHNWCKKNAPYGLLVQSSSGAVGLIRKNSVSLFRGLENVELLIDDASSEVGNLGSFGLELSDDSSEREILFEVLRCIINIGQQLGRASSSIFYESFVGKSNISSEEIIPRLVKILETGYDSSIGAIHVPNLGADVAWEKELADHKKLRDFSIEMLLSLHSIYKKAASWEKVLNVIESYLQFLVPQKITQKSGSETLFNMKNSVVIQAACQIAEVMFESAVDVLLFLSYLVNIGGQINMSHDDISKIQLELVPMIQEIVFEWLIILFFGITPSESPAIEDFSSQLSSLHIDSNIGKRSWSDKLGKCDFTLGSILLLNIPNSSEEESRHSSGYLPHPEGIISSLQKFNSWILWGRTGEESSSFLRRSTDLAVILLGHGQYDAVEHLLFIVETNSQREKIFKSIQETNGDWCLLQHLLGCCFLAQTQRGLHGMLKERKAYEAVRCFFRASSGQGASQALQSLTHEAGFSYLGFNGHVSSSAWKLHYYQWAMQLFEQYNISEGACQFALAALEQVDEALKVEGDGSGKDTFNESAATIKGRLWANIFKFTLDLNLLNDAYCAIISNPDEESKYICLRRFIIVLYDRGAVKVLCDGQLPFIGLADKIERELAWKAERSDVLAKPNPYKLLYAFEMHRHNWRRAANYIYLYTARLRTESLLRDQHASLALQERLNGLSAAINALHLVHPSYAWIDPQPEGNALQNEHYPSKKAKKIVKEQTGNGLLSQRLQFYIDIEKLECEFVLTSAEYLLSLENIKYTYSEIQKPPSDLVDLLVQTNLYDMAFTILLKYWKDSGLKRELEKVFSAMSLKCCPSTWSSTLPGTHTLLLTSSKDEVVVHGSPDMGPTIQQSKANAQWETLELYLEKYKGFHARLPVIVAETLLRTDSQIELPLWLVNMFKDGHSEKTWGMAGQEPSPASLFRLYVDYGRYMEATSLFLEYMEAFTSMKPVNIINRKRPFAVWFPYTALEALWCQLEGLINSGHMVDQCEKLKNLLRGALLNYLKQVKVDSEDVVSSSAVGQGNNRT